MRDSPTCPSVPTAPRRLRPARLLLASAWLLLSLLAAVASAQTPNPEFGYLEGRIVELQYTDPAAPTAGGAAVVRLGSGERVNAEVPASVEVAGSAITPYRVGDQVELYYSQGPGGQRTVVVVDWIRRPALFVLVALFLFTSVAVARFKGLRAFVATSASLAIVIAFIVPRILDGWSPILVSLVGAGSILLLSIYFVHGLNWSTTAAIAGTFGAVVVTMVLGVAFMHFARLTGFGTEEAMMISFGASQVSMRGLLLAGLLVGALGALTDTTIVQASVVRELAHVDPELPWLSLYSSGMRVGYDHIGSLVNTLVLAYAGSALPLLVLLTMGDFTLARAVNIELVATEVVHTLVGSIGLVLSVPITTAIAALMFAGGKMALRPGELHAGHKH